VIELAGKIDTLLYNLCIENQISPLTLSGIILARLKWLNEVTNNGSEYEALCELVSKPNVTAAEKVLQKYRL
jgi:hypothetical protein